MIRRTNVISWFAAGEEEEAGNLASRCIQSAIVIGIIGAAATIDLGSISDACVVDPRPSAPGSFKRPLYAWEEGGVTQFVT